MAFTWLWRGHSREDARPRGRESKPRSAGKGTPQSPPGKRIRSPGRPTRRSRAGTVRRHRAGEGRGQAPSWRGVERAESPLYNRMGSGRQTARRRKRFMRNALRQLRSILSVLAGMTTALLLATGSAIASDMTKVSGNITDDKGQPLAKVQVYFENAAIKGKRVGPVKTDKKGHYIHPFLDVGIEPEWRVVPQLPGYMVLKVKWRQVDSERQEQGSNEVTLNSKQEFPTLRPVMVGTDGVNEVNFAMVKEQDFV